jgi:hypothetical protein
MEKKAPFRGFDYIPIYARLSMWRKRATDAEEECRSRRCAIATIPQTVERQQRCP